jgi:hypothetical protein
MEFLLDIWGFIADSAVLTIIAVIFIALFAIAIVSAIIGQIYSWITGRPNPALDMMGALAEGLGDAVGSIDFSSDGGCDGGGGD